MSGYTMTQGELIYAADIAGTVTANQTPIQPANVGYPPIVIPGGFFANASESYRQSSILVEWGGLFIATATVPTFTISFVTNTADTFAATATLVTSGTFTPAASTGEWFDCRLHIAARTIPISTLTAPTMATISAHGIFTIYPAAASAVSYSLPVAASTYSPAGVFDTTIQQYLYPCLTLGTGTAGNTLTTEYLKVYGQN